MADYIVGKRAILEALSAKVPMSCAFVESGADAQASGSGSKGSKHSSADRQRRRAKSGDFDELVEKLRAVGTNIEYVPRKKLDSMLRDKNSDGGHGSQNSYNAAHQGIIAKVAPFKYADLSSVTNTEGEATCPRLVVVCDHITDAGNFGAVVRSAEAMGASAVVIPNRRSASVNASVYKTSAGAVANIPIVQVVNIANALEELKAAGFWVAGATEHADAPLMSANLKGNIALVMGSEGSGISRLVLEKCDFTVAIPQLGHVESLNVAQATSVCVYEWLRQNANALFSNRELTEVGAFAGAGADVSENSLTFRSISGEE